MKKTFLSLMLICGAFILGNAQTPENTVVVVTEVDEVIIVEDDTTNTLFHCRKREIPNVYRQQYIGIYGEMNYQYGQFRDDFTSISGGSFMVIFNKRFAIGATMQKNADQTFAPNFVNPNYPATPRQYLHAGYGGLKMEYTFMTNSIVHFTLPLVMGYGWATANNNEHIYSSDHYKDRASTSSFYVIQPGAQVELNVFKFMKLYAGVNYRFASEADRTNMLNATTLMGFGTVGGIKLGVFDMACRRK